MKGLSFPILLLALVQAACIAGQAAAAGPCTHCGRHAPCNKVCRIECEEKKVEIICWGLKCEDFCAPGCSKPGCKHCETVCEECDESCNPDGVSTAPKKFVWREWMPMRCGQVRTKSKLMKKVITKKIPSYKWVVEDVCGECEAKTKELAVGPSANLSSVLPSVDPNAVLGGVPNSMPIPPAPPGFERGAPR